ncbi:hemopexin repeat-containing protein [Nonomuraea sp. NPDC050556]|uniref:Tc toxin subunit A-related protein n=1 Tax=Nonomuraea sp. NPDC050556 TaxID=3364369 RepID=UPI0037B06DD6
MRGNSLPNYELLFGDLDFRKADAARSVTSPAAYLVDLLRLLEDEIHGATLLDRRPDIREIPLDAQHTNDEVPYLEIVLEILERLVGPDAYEKLRTAKFPFDKPFNLAYERLGVFLAERRVGREELSRLFDRDADVLAREFLGLSPEMVDLVATARPNEADQRAYYNVNPDRRERLEDLADAELFRSRTSLSGAELEELLASEFVRQGEGRVTARDGRLRLPARRELPEWMDRVNRFVRLAHRAHLSLPDLDVVLSACCGNRLDGHALRILATVVHVSRTLDLPIPVVASLVAPVTVEPLELGDVELDRIRVRLAEAGKGDVGTAAPQRAARFMSALGLSADELFDLLAVLDGTFPVPFAMTRKAADSRTILAEPDVESGLWLAQALPALLRWTRANGLSAQDLTDFAGGPRATNAAPFIPAVEAADPAMFVSKRFSERASRAIFDALPEASPYEALTGLAEATEADFLGLGLGDALAAKIFANLVFLGSVAADGTLVEVPTAVATDFSGLRDRVTRLLRRLDGRCYPSDLDDLPGLTAPQREELYDNLVYNGYLSTEGDILDADVQDVNAALDDVAAQVVKLVADRAELADKEPLAIELGFEVEGLLANLEFNRHIDAEGHYRDKRALAALDYAGFALAAEFEPYRADVLDAIQAQLAARRAELCTFLPEAFAQLADEAEARRVLDTGETDLPVAEGRLLAIEAEQRPYRLDLAALGALGFTEEEQQGLVAMLIGGGDLDEGLAVPEDRLAFFSRPTNVLDFYLPGLEDFIPDVFGLLHAVATELLAGVAEIEATRKARAAKEAAALLAVAQDALGVPVPVVSAICAGMEVELADVVRAPGLAHRRAKAFARMAAKLGLSATEVALAFDGQRLAARFPEPLALPAGVDGIDALLDSSDGYVYLFRRDRYWRYRDRVVVDSGQVSALAKSLTGVDAAFRHPDGSEWLVSGSRSYVRERDSQRWVGRDQVWGRIRNEFADHAIEAALVDEEGRACLFAGEQYIRYSTTDFGQVDEGFPRPAADFGELGFHGKDGRFHPFDAPLESAPDPDGPPDAAFADASGVYVFHGDKVIRHIASLENEGAHADDGYPLKIETRFRTVPAEFESGLDAAFTDEGGVLHLFKDGRTVSLTGSREAVETATRWGATRVPFPNGVVDSAFVGLDGRTYLFSGDTYIRYSGSDYSRIDLGFPRLIAPDWGGLTRVGASFVLDGETYLFGDGQFVRYSTGDYGKPDEGYPQPIPGNWWNLPDAFGSSVDAVFTSADDRTYLFSGSRFIEFDVRRRWWSAPRTLENDWDSIPFRSVDAAFVGRDGRTYVFSGPKYVRYSTSDYTEVDDRYPANVATYWGLGRNNLARTGRVDATLQLGSHTYLFSGDQYVRWTGGSPDYGYPRALSTLKTEPGLANLGAELDGVDAAFADQGNVYLFRGPTCHVVSASRYRSYQVPGVRCAFIEDGQLIVEGPDGWRRRSGVEALGVVTEPVRPRALAGTPERFRSGLDAVLQGTDGTTYLFKGDTCYDTLLDRDYPIGEAWGRARGLGAVDAGFAGRDGKTYLFSGDRFTDGGPAKDIAPVWGGLTSVGIAYVDDETTYVFEKPDADGRMRYLVYSGDDYEAPDPGYPQLADAGFWDAEEIPRAVLAVGDGLVLLSGQTYTLPGAELARPIGLLWRGFEGTMTTAYAGADGATYFFYGEQYRRHADGVLGPLTSLTGDSFGHVDAAFTHEGRTYLFSGERYVRYSTDEYVYADPGYPKPIARNFRKEFPGLPESFEDALTTIDAVVANRRNIYVFMGGACHVASRTPYATYENLAGRTRPLDGPIDAALMIGRSTYLLSGDRYTRYTGDQYTSPDEGYPRAIAGSLSRDLGVPELPPEFLDGVDAGFASGGIHLFKGKQYIRADAHGRAAPEWGKVRSAFDGRVDAAFAAPTGEVYAFRGDQYVRCSPDGDGYTYADPGYPRTIKDDWGDLPVRFEGGIDAAFTLGKRVYFLRGAEYVDDDGFARPIAEGWADTADFRLADIYTITRFAALNQALGATLTAPDEDPYKTMAALFGWDPAELMWVQRSMPSGSPMEFALKAVELFALARRVGVAPSKLAAVTGESASPEAVTVLKRDALVSAVVAITPDVEDSADLFERLLIDVEMGGKGTTSRVREAIAAVQLYIHRYLLDLEPGGDEQARIRLRLWWAWMKNYRVWEANRKVFLYPENYLRPELRDTKTPGFVELENELLRSGVTTVTAQLAYKRYLDEYTEVSRLAIAGGYVDVPSDGVRSLVLFGRTRTEPRRHYYRHATFRDGDRMSATWGPWLKVDVRIDAEKVYPVRAFDRTFVFWSTVENAPPEHQESTTIVATSSGDGSQQVSAPPAKRCVKIYFSFLNLNQEWVPAQVLATGAPRTDLGHEVALAVRPGPLPNTDHQAIVVSYTATTEDGVVGASYALTPELYTVPVDRITVPQIAGDVTTIFDEPGGVDPASVVWFNKPAGLSGASWFSVDHKGGSFLCRPLMPAPSDPVTPQTIRTAAGLPSWDRVNAGFELPNGTRFFFDGPGGRYSRLLAGETRSERFTPIGRTFGRANPFGPPRFPPRPPEWRNVDTAWISGQQIFLTNGDQLIRYTLGPAPDYQIPEFADDGYPITIPARLTAVFRGYAMGTMGYAKVGDWRFGPTAGNWEDLPDGVTGAMETKDGLLLFLDTKVATYPKGTGPYSYAELPHDIVRLTTSTAYKLNQRLLAGGVPALLDTTTQETDELPAFDIRRSDATTIRVHEERVVPAWLPGRTHLDFGSANGCYYWEIFFHAPLLIAQSLNAAQRFEEARTWYEYVFDPTRSDQYWRFLPFLGADPGALAEALRESGDGRLKDAIALLESLVPVFRGIGDLTEPQRRALADLGRLSPSEDVAIAAELGKVYDQLGDRAGLMDAYRNDPFDPHAVAALRPVAYRRAVVAGYIDNLIDWGDLLFRQYTGESIDEARMLYILAFDLLGRRPESLAPLPQSPALAYGRLDRAPSGQDLVRVHASTADPYFHVPVNDALGGYWDLVADRLTKIRASLDILGISRPLPLFEPPIDPMALVARVAANGLPDAVTDAAADVPHQRFSVVFRRAQELADRVRDFGGSLLDVLERRDSEALSLLQSNHEAALLDLTRGIKEAQVTAAAENLSALQAGLTAAGQRVTYYQQLIAEGASPLQEAQIAMMSMASAAHFASGGLKIAAAIAHATPEAYVGPFIMGASFGGEQLGDSLDAGSAVSESFGEAFSMLGEVLGVRAEQERAVQDWELQLATSNSEVTQIGYQVAGATAQLAMAQRELDVLNREIANQQEVAAFLRDKFAGASLYQWMSGRMAELYFSAYGMAYELARAAERAYQFERGTTESIIKPVYWDSRRNGLLAGHALLLDLDRLAKAHASTDTRPLEITRRTSLLELDPIALMNLHTTGSCEFALTEEFFDHDFPGHHRRQLRTMALSFVDAEGTALTVNASLTQTSSKTVLTPDPKAVAYLLDPKGPPPATLRADWRPGQRIALSHVAEGYENNGLFELRYDDERYLPFEGTGAVSTWLLELPGLRTADRPANLYDVVITLRYTAEHGGDVFANTVKGLLKPYPAAKYFDVAADFPQAWEALGETLDLPITPDLLPDVYGRQITGLYPVYDLAEAGAAQFALNGTALADGQLVSTPGLPLSNGLRLSFSGDREALRGFGLVVTYRAGTR